MRANTPVIAALTAALWLVLISPASPAQPHDGEKQAPAAATVVGTEIHTDDPEEMRYLILRALTNRYAADRGIEVRPADIDAYVAGMARLAEQDREQRRARRLEIDARLASPGLGDAERKALTSELDSLSQLSRSSKSKAASRS